MIKHPSPLALFTLLAAALPLRAQSTQPTDILPAQMQSLYDEVKTPYKYGVVLEPPPGQKIDCPAVFRKDHHWYMFYVQLENKPTQGYTTQLATSDDLLHWKPLGTILDRGPADAWDHANAGAGPALFDTTWGGEGGSNELRSFEGRYWLSYLGGSKYGYETVPLSIGLASTTDPTISHPWDKVPAPVLTPSDPSARPDFETVTLYKSYIFEDPAKTLGSPFVMFYNAKGTTERIFCATSPDMKTWTRVGTGPALTNEPPLDYHHGVISGDPQVVRIHDTWVMFYFGAFWKPGAFNTFAASNDLLHWTKWTGDNLVQPSEPYDTPFAHKSWVLKSDGIVYHFYCAVGGKDQYRTIALATSKDLRAK